MHRAISVDVTKSYAGVNKVIYWQSSHKRFQIAMIFLAAPRGNRRGAVAAGA